MKSSDISNKEFFPTELALEILTDLSFEEIVNISLVSKGFKEFTRNDFFREDKFKLHFPEVYQKILTNQKEAADEYARLTEVDKAEFPDIEKQLLERKKPIADWYAQFAKEYTLDGLSPSVREILYSLREGRTEKLSEITFDMLKKRDKNNESILSFAQKKGDQSLLDYFYQIVEKAYSEFRDKVNPKDKQDRTLLHWAVMLNQRERILEILQTKPGLLNQKDDFWNTPLMLAVNQNQEDMVSLFLEQEKIDISVKNRNGLTALHLASMTGNEAIVGRLIKANPSVSAQLKMLIAVQLGHLTFLEEFVNDAPSLLPDVRSNQKMTLLMMAAWYGWVEIVNFLLNKNTIPLNVMSQGFNDTTKNDLTALDFAALSGNATIVEAIVNAMNEIIALESLKKLLLIAAREKHLALVKWIVEYSHRHYPENKLELLQAKDADSKTPLLFAMHNKDIAMVFFLLKNGAMTALDKPAQGELLLEAAREGYLSLVKQLIKDDPSLLGYKNNQAETALQLAMYCQHKEIVEWLVDKVMIEELDKSAQKKLLLTAAEQGYLSLVKQLIEADPGLLNEGDECGQTALIWAASKGQEVIVDFLLRQSKINVDAVSSNFPKGRKELNDCTALYWAARNGHIKIVEALLAKNANASLANAEGRLPLHIAASKGHETIVRALITANPGSLNQPNAYRETPLILASRCNHLSVVQFLLEQPGVGIRIPDIDGNQPIHWPANNLHVKMMELLLKKDPSLVNQSNTDGLTPLMLTVFDVDYHKIALPAVEFLLKQPGINVWAMNIDTVKRVNKDQCGWTVLHYAADRKNYVYHDNDDVVKDILKHMLTDMLKPDFSKSLIVPVNCERLTKKTSFAIQLLQFLVKEKKREVPTPYSLDLFSNKRQAVVDPRIKEVIRVATLLINLIIYDQNPKNYESDLARFQRVLENNAELHQIYAKLCEVDSRFELTSHELTLK